MEAELYAHVEYLTSTVGERNFVRYSQLLRAQEWLQGWLPQLEVYHIGEQAFANLTLELPGTDEIVVVGAHYDSLVGTVGANDNGTGVAALLALASRWKDRPVGRTLRFVAFANEEPPFFGSADMGSYRYAEGCRKRGERILGMLCLETMGYYRDEPGTQRYPEGIAPVTDVGDFILFVGPDNSAAWVRDVAELFRARCDFPCRDLSASPDAVSIVNWSDHWPFTEMGYPGLMITDTAPFRYPYYHTTQDTVDKIDFKRLARVVEGLDRVLAELVRTES